jgi:hypothetical protein
VAFNAYISSCTIFLNCSYAGPILILLIRGRETIEEQRPDFALGRVGGYVANGVAVVYVGVTSVVCMLDGVARKRISIIRDLLTREWITVLLASEHRGR